MSLNIDCQENVLDLFDADLVLIDDEASYPIDGGVAYFSARIVYSLYLSTSYVRGGKNSLLNLKSFPYSGTASASSELSSRTWALSSRPISTWTWRLRLRSSSSSCGAQDSHWTRSSR